MPGDRLVEQQHLGVLHQQHADLEPLLLAVRQDAGGDVGAGRSSPIVSSAALDLVGHPGPAAQQRQRAAAAAGRDVEVLQHRQLLEHRRGLERAADAEPDDLVRPSGPAGPARRTRADPVAVHQPGDGVDQRGLAGAVRSDEEAQLALEQRQVDAVDGLEPVEVDGQVA